MKYKNIIGTIIGAAIGMTLGYFGAGSLDAVNLLIGTFAGAVVGLYLVTASTMMSPGKTSGRRSEMG